MDRILIIDDEPSMLEFLEIMLRKEGYAAATAKSGAEAVAKLGQESFDLVISDIQMPEVSGIEVLRRVKEVAPDAAVIMITGMSAGPSRRSASMTSVPVIWGICMSRMIRSGCSLPASASPAIPFAALETW